MKSVMVQCDLHEKAKQKFKIKKCASPHLFCFFNSVGDVGLSDIFMQSFSKLETKNCQKFNPSGVETKILDNLVNAIVIYLLTFLVAKHWAGHL